MKKLEDKAKELKCKKISLHVFVHNAVSAPKLTNE